jgi:hypothetical protein
MGLLLLLGNTGTAFSGALDNLGTGLESAWSVGRRLRAAYTGAIIRVRRSSDNTEQDFSGSGATGAVDTAVVAAFCGAGNGFLTTIYDQSGNGRNLTQSTTTKQPAVVESGVAVTAGTRLAAKYVTATNQSMSVAASSSLFNFMHTTAGSVAVVCQSNNTVSNKSIIRTNSGASTPGFQLTRSTTDRLILSAGQINVAGSPTAGTSVLINTTADLTSTANTIIVALYDPDNGTASARARVWGNGTQSATSNAATGTPFVENSTGNLFVGNSTNETIPFDGTIQEAIIWSVLQSDANRDVYEANAGTFYGITVA